MHCTCFSSPARYVNAFPSPRARPESHSLWRVLEKALLARTATNCKSTETEEGTSEQGYSKGLQQSSALWFWFSVNTGIKVQTHIVQSSSCHFDSVFLRTRFGSPRKEFLVFENWPENFLPWQNEASHLLHKRCFAVLTQTKLLLLWIVPSWLWIIFIYSFVFSAYIFP